MNIPQQLQIQIKDAWAVIDRRIELLLVHSGEDSHLDSFRSFLSDAANLNANMIFKESIEKGTDIHFRLIVEGQETGIIFQGIPLGHELSSFVLSVLVAVGKAKMPDERTIRRIQSLKGDIQLVSYVSLSCENCPDVVQALNIFAALNPNIKHTMVEGSLFQEEVQAQGVLSVPTVKLNGNDFSTGRQDMSQLLEKLEEQFAVKSWLISI